MVQRGRDLCTVRCGYYFRILDFTWSIFFQDWHFKFLPNYSHFDVEILEKNYDKQF